MSTFTLPKMPPGSELLELQAETFAREDLHMNEAHACLGVYVGKRTVQVVFDLGEERHARLKSTYQREAFESWLVTR